MSLNEILEAIPNLSFAERQQVVRRAIEADEDLTSEEEAILEERLKDFRADRRDGVPDQFALASHDHPAQSLEPFAGGHFRFLVQPLRHIAELLSGHDQGDDRAAPAASCAAGF